MPVKVVTTLGEIQARYSGVLFTMANGEALPFETLCVVCEIYWNKWQKDAEQGAQPDAFGAG
jgi:hypothetical protein